MPRVRLTADEQQRMLAAQATGLIDKQHVRLLLPTGGGPNALAAAPIAFGLSRESEAPVQILWVEPQTTWRSRLAQAFGRAPVRDGSAHVEALKAMAVGNVPPAVRKVVAADVSRAICDEAARGTDIILLGSNEAAGIAGTLIEEVVARAPCHVAIMRARRPVPSYRSLFVPVDGSVASRLAVEFAHRYAENTGAELTLAVLTERRPQAAAYADQSGTYAGAEMRPTTEEELERISVVFRASAQKPSILSLAYDPLSSSVTSEVRTGKYDLVILGAENRAIQHRLFFGYDNERLIRAAAVPVIVVVPNLTKLT
jgi:nucleotide-binding universal stress UspA family protein